MAFTIVALVVLAVVLVAVGVVLWRRQSRAEEPETPAPPRRAPVPAPPAAANRPPAPREEAPAAAWDKEFDRETVLPSLDWYILRHLEDQRRMPLRQAFLDDDRRHNDLLNRYVIHQMSKQGVRMTPPASTLTESVRPDDVAHYFPRYFPDAEMDSALAMYKHELIANRLIDTIAYVHRLRDGRAAALTAFAGIRPGFTPFVPDAYVAFYNDLVGAADSFDREKGLRDTMRVLAVRMLFPAKEPQFDYWRARGYETLQIPLAVAREAVTSWFFLKESDVPLAAL
jgi:hypothetical protein